MLVNEECFSTLCVMVIKMYNIPALCHIMTYNIPVLGHIIT